MHSEILFFVVVAFVDIASANFDVYFEGAFNPMKQQDWAYRVFNAKPADWPTIEKVKRFGRKDWNLELDSGQIPEGFVGCLAPSDCDVLRGCDMPCSANPSYSGNDIKVFEMNFNSDPAVDFHWILYQDDPHKDFKGDKVAAAPDGRRWMYNVGSNVEPKGYCIEFPGDDYLGVKKELGDYFKHGTRKLRCIHPDVWGNDINDPEAYKRRTAPKPEASPEPSHSPEHDPQAECARQGNCESQAASSSSETNPLGTLHIAVVASTTITKTVIHTVDATKIETVPWTEVETVSAYPEQTVLSTSGNPPLVPSNSAANASPSLRNNRREDSSASVILGDPIPFIIDRSTTITKTHVVNVDSTGFKTIASTKVYTVYTVPSAPPVTSTGSSLKPSSTMTSHSRASASSGSISTSQVKAPSLPAISHLPSSSAIHSVNSSPSSPADPSNKTPVVATSFVTVIITSVAISKSTTSYFDDGMWHTYYPIQSV